MIWEVLEGGICDLVEEWSWYLPRGTVWSH